MTQPVQKSHTLDAHRFSTLHETYHDRLLATVTGMVRDHNKAEDITAKAFQIGWEKREQFRGDASAYTWLYAIARSRVWQAYRRREALPLDAVANVVAEGGDLVESLERQDALNALQQALTQIPTIYRRVIVACFLNGETTQAFAEREGIPQGTVLSRIFTGKRLLRAKLKTTP
jgi:RNA polymerase sigma-70 factor (ECF subfamily)